MDMEGEGQSSNLSCLMKILEANTIFYAGRIGCNPWMEEQHRNDIRIALAKTHPSKIVNGTLQLEIWLTMITTLQVWKSYFWKLYERVQIKTCAEGGQGRKRDRADFEADKQSTSLYTDTVY